MQYFRRAVHNSCYSGTHAIHTLMMGPRLPSVYPSILSLLSDISGATDVSNMTFANMTTLPQHVKPVTKALLIDVAQELNDRVRYNLTGCIIV